MIAPLPPPRARGNVYDTGWIASLADPDAPSRPRYPRSLAWIVSQQRPDGGFGSLGHQHNRLICTLSALRAMARFRDHVPPGAVNAAQQYIWLNAHRLPNDQIETTGFELLVPALRDELEALGVAMPPYLDRYTEERRQKLTLIPETEWYRPSSSISHSIEFLGSAADPQRLAGLQGPNGAITNSPATTAYLLQFGPNPAAQAYLEWSMSADGASAPTLAPCAFFEGLWVGYHRAIAGAPPETWLDPELRATIRERLLRGEGISTDPSYPPVDVDDTAVAILLLRWLGEPIGGESLRPFARDTGYVTYQAERHPSSSANAHVLQALCALPPSPERDARIGVALDFLEGHRVHGTFWSCKWHASAYYATCRVLRALAGLPPEFRARGAELARPALEWLGVTQRHYSGGWGFFSSATAEETAYGIIGLFPWMELMPDGWIVEAVARAGAALPALRAVPDEEMWSGKSLYLPTPIVDAVIEAGQALASRTARQVNG